MTGGSGFVGGRLVDSLLDAGMRVRALQHRTPVPPRDNLEIVDGALDDPDALVRLVAGTEAVVHCGGLVAARRPDDFYRVNAEGTRRIAEAAREAGTKRFLLISSLAARQQHLSAYAASKRAAEKALADVRGLAWDVLRPPAVYGPGDRQVLIFLRLIKRGIGLLPAGASTRVSLLHVGDLAEAVRVWLHGPAPTGEIYELADAQSGGYTWRALIDAAARELTVEPRYVVAPGALLDAVGYGLQLWGRVGGRAPFLTPGKLRELRHPDWVCRDERFQRLTGWRPRVPFPDGLRETVAWYRERSWL